MSDVEPRSGAPVAGLIDQFAGLRVAVIGDAIVDAYLVGGAARLSQEAPVPVVTVRDHAEAPGGAANTAVNAAALGAQVELLSAVGDDAAGARLRTLLEAAGVSTAHLGREPGRATITKTRVVAGQQMLVRVDDGDVEPVGSDAEGGLVRALASMYPTLDAVVVSDYGYGAVTPALVRRLGELQARTPVLLVVDAKDLGRYSKSGVTVVKPNYAQAVAILGAPEEDGERRVEQIPALGEELLERTGAQIAAVTLDVDGALVFERGRPAYRTYARPREDSRSTGAGDTFAATLAVALAAGASTPVATELASAAAGIVVGRERTAVCTAAELRAFFSSSAKYEPAVERLAGLADLYRAQGKRIVFTNGCFDILHRGHIAYLNRAKAFGDVLIVALNSDQSVRRLKGANRPINTLEDRAEILAALSAVDHIVPFEEDTPARVIEAVRPDVFVKGGDYTIEMLPEAPIVRRLGGVVHILPYVEDRSTTGIIERIRAQRAEIG